MQTNPESAAVEAVAWAMTDYQADGANTQFTRDRHAAEYWGEQGIQIDPLYPQSALDALRGEVERRKSAQAALSQYASAAEQRADAAERRLDEVREIQRSNYGDGVGLHLAMIRWAREYDAITKESP